MHPIGRNAPDDFTDGQSLVEGRYDDGYFHLNRSVQGSGFRVQRLQVIETDQYYKNSSDLWLL
jgi:hypothetical protein